MKIIFWIWSIFAIVYYVESIILLAWDRNSVALFNLYAGHGRRVRHLLKEVMTNEDIARDD